MSMDFLKGLGSINLFPKERDRELNIINFKIPSNEEAFKKDMEAVSKDMWNAIKIIQNEHPEYK